MTMEMIFIIFEMSTVHKEILIISCRLKLWTEISKAYANGGFI